MYIAQKYNCCNIIVLLPFSVFARSCILVKKKKVKKGVLSGYTPNVLLHSLNENVRVRWETSAVDIISKILPKQTDGHFAFELG